MRGVLLKNGEELPADFVVIAARVRPNSHLARQSGLKVHGGVVVDDRMFTSDPAILAAGDMAEHRGRRYGIGPGCSRRSWKATARPRSSRSWFSSFQVLWGTRQIERFELADGGTIFLDEIGEMPLELQSKVLRVIQDGEFERLGSPLTHKIDVRIIAATIQRSKRLLLRRARTPKSTCCCEV